MIYRKSYFGHRLNSGGHRECPGTTGGVPGVHRVGPPIPVGPLGCKGEVSSPQGWRTTRGPPPHAPRVKTLRGRGAPLALGGKEPPWPPPPCRLDLQGAQAHPPWPLYICGEGEGSRTQALAPLPLPSHLHTPTQGARRSPAAISTASVITPSCCRISDDFSSPLAGSRRR